MPQETQTAGPRRPGKICGEAEGLGGALPLG